MKRHRASLRLQWRKSITIDPRAASGFSEGVVEIFIVLMYFG
jgi:hypothetical protein